MANNYRVISSFRKDPNLLKLLKAIDNKFPQYELGCNTPIPNQALETATTKSARPTCLYFSTAATEQLATIRKWAQEKSEQKLSSKKEDKPIDFLCKGYIDFSGDIIIYDISVPQTKIFKEQNLDAKEALLKSIQSKDANIELLSEYYDYLRETTINKTNGIGIMPIALLGTTRPIISTNDKSEYCPKLSEIAKAIIPANVEINHPIMSGTLSVSPMNIVQTPNGKQYSNGSLECIIIDYNYHENNKVSPKRYLNITQCQQTNPYGKLSIVDISKSKQPLEGLPLLSQEHTM